METKICYRGKKRFVRRLCPGSSHIMGDTDIVLTRRGKLDNLSVSSFSGYNDELPHDTVEVSVHAVCLNFKDVLDVLLPDEAAYVGHDTPPLPGADFAGEIMSIPSSSSDRPCPFSVGDKVYGLSLDMLRSRARVSLHSITKMPYNLSFEEASTLPMVFLTVSYVLKEQAKRKSGDRILIHSAAGGVGLVAIQYAQSIGAEVYATASPSKHDYLRSIGLKYMSTSRVGGIFAAEMRHLVCDQGVDVVLSSGNLVAESLSLLGTNGRFLELGKRNILSKEEMEQKRPDVAYFTRTLNELIHDDPAQVSDMLKLVTDEVDSGVVRPLPAEVFDFENGVVDALQRLRSGNTIGTVVISVQGIQDIGVAVITGGLGGLGLVTAEALVNMGA